MGKDTKSCVDIFCCFFLLQVDELTKKFVKEAADRCKAKEKEIMEGWVCMQCETDTDRRNLYAGRTKGGKYKRNTARWESSPESSISAAHMGDMWQVMKFCIKK